MIHNLLHHYGHPLLYVIVIIGSMLTVAGVIIAGKHYRPSRKERARRRARAAREKAFDRSRAPISREVTRGGLPTPRSEALRPKTMPFAPGGGNPLRTPQAAVIVPFSPPQEQESRGIRTPIAPTPPDLKQGGS